MAAAATSGGDNSYPSIATSTSMLPNTTSVTTITTPIIKLLQHYQQRFNPYCDNDDLGTHYHQRGLAHHICGRGRG